MNVKKISTILLALFVIFGVGYYLYSEIITNKNSKTKTTGTSDKNSKSTQKHIINVYYFHTSYRCRSCTTIEKYTREAVNLYFPKELKNGSIIISSINVDEPDNKHYIEEYKLHTKTVVLVDNFKGKKIKWKTLPKTWTLLRDKDKFFEYIKTEVYNYLEGLDG